MSDVKDYSPLPIDAQNERNGSIREAPPPTIRGVQNTSGLVMAGVTIDWISATFPDDEKTRKNLRGTFQPESERDKGLYSYDRAATVLVFGTMLWSSTDPSKGIHLILPSQALAQWVGGPFVLLSIILNNGGRFTRLDLAMDDFAGLLDIGTIIHKLDYDEVRTRLRKRKAHFQGGEIGSGPARISGVTIGKRDSESYIRIYDKLLERQEKGITVDVTHWVRVELETKGDRATPLAEMLLKLPDNEARAKQAAALIFGLLDFKEPDQGDTNKTRWETSPWWSEFLGNVSKARLTLPRPEQTLETVKDWFSHSIAPMAYVILIAEHYAGQSGYDWLIETIAAGEERLKHRHKKILAGAAA